VTGFSVEQNYVATTGHFGCVERSLLKRRPDQARTTLGRSHRRRAKRGPGPFKVGENENQGGVQQSSRTVGRGGWAKNFPLWPGENEKKNRRRLTFGNPNRKQASPIGSPYTSKMDHDSQPGITREGRNRDLSFCKILGDGGCESCRMI